MIIWSENLSVKNKQKIKKKIKHTRIQWSEQKFIEN